MRYRRGCFAVVRNLYGIWRWYRVGRATDNREGFSRESLLFCEIESFVVSNGGCQAVVEGFLISGRKFDTVFVYLNINEKM